MPACSFIYRLRAFFACFPAPCGFRFYRSRRVPRVVRAFFLSSGSYLVPFLSFSRVRSLLLSRRFLSLWTPLSPFHLFPVRFPHCRRLPWCDAVSLSACSRLVSRLGIRCGRAVRRYLFRGLGDCPVAWSCGDGRVFCRSVGRLVFYGARDGAFWVVFSCGNYRRVVRGARRICCVWW